MSTRPLIDGRGAAVTGAALLLVSLVGLASGGSPWQASGGQEIPDAVVQVLAAAAGALVVGSLLLVWVGTPSGERRPKRTVERPDARRLVDLGASLSAAGKAAAIVGGAIGLFLLVSLPFLVPAQADRDVATRGSTPAGGGAVASAPAPTVDSIALPWLGAGCVAALALLAPVAVLVRRRHARRERRAIVPDPAAQVVAGLRWSLVDLETEPDPRRAVERAYGRMEESLGSVQLSRAPSETPSELASRVLRVLGASGEAASELAGLLEVARFSDHPMDEGDRRRAITAVRRVEAEVAVR